MSHVCIFADEHWSKPNVSQEGEPVPSTRLVFKHGGFVVVVASVRDIMPHVCIFADEHWSKPNVSQEGEPVLSTRLVFKHGGFVVVVVRFRCLCLW